MKTAVFLLAGLHRGWWRFVGINDLLRVFFANVVASAVLHGGCFVNNRSGWSSVTLDLFRARSTSSISCLCFLMTAGARFAVRLYIEGIRDTSSKTGGKGLLIYGAGGSRKDVAAGKFAPIPRSATT